MVEQLLTANALTKTQIKKLGKAIRLLQKSNQEITDDCLLELQKYRTSFQKDIAEVFRVLSDVSRRVRKDRVITFRIKRIESILSKIGREDTMQLDTMGDIAGCRCIVQSDAAVWKIVEAIEKRLVIKRRKDYLTVSKADGYRSYHLYVQSPINNDRQIEIQIRSQEAHNWATLVEIIDVLYDRKIKEGEQQPELKEFLLLMSKKDILINTEKDKVIDIENRYKIYNSLSTLFVKNYLIIRRAWFKLESRPENTFFVISVDKNKSPQVASYKTYQAAEDVYFNTFSNNKDSNVVLTHLDEFDFRKLCIAYSNYVLIKHTFLNDWRNMMLEQIENEFLAKNRKRANQIVSQFKEMINEEAKHLKTEVDELTAIIENKNWEHSLSDDSKLDEWLEELEDRMAEGRQTKEKLNSIIDKNGQSLLSQIFN